jgi:ATP-binding cassette subfamily F protein 3
MAVASSVKPSSDSAKEPAKRPDPADKSTRRKRKFPYRKLAELEQDIHEREQRIADVHASLATPEVLRDGNRVRQLKAELDETQKSLATLYEHWEEAMELN